MALPQATVQLQGTQQLGAPTGPATAPTMSTIGTIAVDDEEESSDLIPTILSILAFVLSLAVLGLALAAWLKENEFAALFE